MRKVSFILIMAISLVSCKKSDYTEDHPDVLTVEENKIVEGISELNNINPELMILPNDLSVKTFLQEVDPAFYGQWGRFTSESIVNGSVSIYDNLGPRMPGII